MATNTGSRSETEGNQERRKQGNPPPAPEAKQGHPGSGTAAPRGSNIPRPSDAPRRTDVPRPSDAPRPSEPGQSDAPRQGESGTRGEPYSPLATPRTEGRMRPPGEMGGHTVQPWEQPEQGATSIGSKSRDAGGHGPGAVAQETREAAGPPRETGRREAGVGTAPGLTGVSTTRGAGGSDVRDSQTLMGQTGRTGRTADADGSDARRTAGDSAAPGFLGAKVQPPPGARPTQLTFTADDEALIAALTERLAQMLARALRETVAQAVRDARSETMQPNGDVPARPAKAA